METGRQYQDRCDMLHALVLSQLLAAQQIREWTGGNGNGRCNSWRTMAGAAECRCLAVEIMHRHREGWHTEAAGVVYRFGQPLPFHLEVRKGAVRQHRYFATERALTTAVAEFCDERGEPPADIDYTAEGPELLHCSWHLDPAGVAALMRLGAL